MHEKKSVNILLEILLWLFSLLIIYPLGMVLMTSFKSYGESNILSIRPPTEWLISNYEEVWTKGKILQSFLNSTYITVFSVILILLCSSMLSYIVVRRRNRFNRFVSKFLTFGIIAPFAALPTIEMLKMMGIYGTRTSLVLIYAAIYLPFTSMLFSSFIVGIPKELDEAAIIDGCTGFPLFARIIMPLLKPVTARTGILNFMWVWNDFQYPMYLLNTSAKYTLPLSIYSFFGTFNRSWNLVCADMVMVSLPVILLYLFAQKYIIAGMTAGAVKG